LVISNELTNIQQTEQCGCRHLIAQLFFLMRIFIPSFFDRGGVVSFALGFVSFAYFLDSQWKRNCFFDLVRQRIMKC